MKVNFLGDLHCDGTYKSKFKENTIQVGDLCLWNFKAFEFLAGKRYFIDGNHEAFHLIDPDYHRPYPVVENLIYIPRGYVSGNVLFVGGAGSIDKHLRTPGHSWFPEEDINENQLKRILSIEGDIEAVVAHDIPYFVLEKIVPIVMDEFAHTNKALEVIFNKFNPKLWVFGHHHKSIDMTMNGCRFVCLAEGESKILDVPIDEKFFNIDHGLKE